MKVGKMNFNKRETGIAELANLTREQALALIHAILNVFSNDEKPNRKRRGGKRRGEQLRRLNTLFLLLLLLVTACGGAVAVSPTASPTSTNNPTEVLPTAPVEPTKTAEPPGQAFPPPTEEAPANNNGTNAGNGDSGQPQEEETSEAEGTRIPDDQVRSAIVSFATATPEIVSNPTGFAERLLGARVNEFDTNTSFVIFDGIAYVATRSANADLTIQYVDADSFTEETDENGQKTVAFYKAGQQTGKLAPNSNGQIELTPTAVAGPTPPEKENDGVDEITLSPQEQLLVEMIGYDPNKDMNLFQEAGGPEIAQLSEILSVYVMHQPLNDYEPVVSSPIEFVDSTPEQYQEAIETFMDSINQNGLIAIVDSSQIPNLNIALDENGQQKIKLIDGSSDASPVVHVLPTPGQDLVEHISVVFSTQKPTDSQGNTIKIWSSASSQPTYLTTFYDYSTKTASVFLTLPVGIFENNLKNPRLSRNIIGGISIAGNSSKSDWTAVNGILDNTTSQKSPQQEALSLQLFGDGDPDGNGEVDNINDFELPLSVELELVRP